MPSPGVAAVSGSSGVRDPQQALEGVVQAAVLR